MASETIQLKIRMPAALREKIVEIARNNRRSVTSEIVTVLERSVLNSNELKKGDTALFLSSTHRNR